mmetsp:Transcript_39131/g.37459  ORF Transcript_39131/g.37459 Transcript_39131/m.37459 type:complete len:113 (+) Transcript_39131:429-767(+)
MGLVRSDQAFFPEEGVLILVRVLALHMDDVLLILAHLLRQQGPLEQVLINRRLLRESLQVDVLLKFELEAFLAVSLASLGVVHKGSLLPMFTAHILLLHLLLHHLEQIFSDA